MSAHPKGTRARVLLSSVFGPYAQDDEYGSRAINPMELYHNQVTRGQGPFSLRMFHRSWGLMLIQANISAALHAARLPDAATASSRRSDAGSTTSSASASIIANVGKVREMCRLMRQHSPQSTIVVGGHVANDSRHRADRSTPTRSSGARASAGSAQFLGEPVDRPVHHPRHPVVVRLPPVRAARAARRRQRGRDDHPVGRLPDGLQLLLDLGHVRRQGQVHQLLRDGRGAVPRDVRARSRRWASRRFFMMDENFLLHRKRALACST